jgi:hypothetical protein
MLDLLAGLGPTFELPAHSFTDSSRIEGSVMAPATAKRRPVLGLYFDGEAGTHQTRPAKTGVQFFSQGFADEGSRVQLLGWRV